MYCINHHRRPTANTIPDKLFKPPDRFFLAQFQMEAFPDLQHRLVGFELDVLDIRIDHQGKQVQDEVAGFPESRVGREAVGSESRVIRGRIATHALDHFLAELHGRREWLGVPTEDVAEVGVKEVAWKDQLGCARQDGN